MRGMATDTCRTPVSLQSTSCRARHALRPRAAPHDPRGARRRRRGGRRRAGGRAVDDQHRHRRRRRRPRSRSPNCGAPARNWCGSRSTRPKPPPPCRASSTSCAMMGVEVPIIGDFHYNGHQLLDRRTGLRRGAGQVPHQSRQRRLRQEEATRSSRTLIEFAISYDKPVRIGANWGSLDQALADAADGREPRCAPSPGTPAACCAKR